MKKNIILMMIIAVSFLSLGIVIGREKNDNFEEENDKRIKNENTISMMLETEAGSGNYEMTTRDSWPTEGYIFNSELSKCENGGELSWDDTNKRVLMSGNISDKCYVYFDKPLEFYLDDVLFQAAPNMTWTEWINSSYSDEWYYKNKIYSYQELINMGASTSSGYYPMGNGETYCTNKILTKGDGYNVSIGALITAKDYGDLSSIGTSQPYVILDYSFNDTSANYKNLSKNSLLINSNEKIADFLKEVDKIWSDVTGKNEQFKLDNNYYFLNVYFACLTPNTLIDVEEIDEKGKKRRRRKKLKDIKVGDKVICINPVTLELDTDTVIECDGEMNKKHTCYDNWYFDDGTIITTVHRHRFYNVENSKFMYMEEWNIGEHGINIENKKIKLIKHEHIEEEIKHCTLFTEKYNNYFANGLLSGNRKSKNIVL